MISQAMCHQRWNKGLLLSPAPLILTGAHSLIIPQSTLYTDSFVKYPSKKLIRHPKFLSYFRRHNKHINIKDILRLVTSENVRYQTDSLVLQQ
jgi:hypothetical protein